MVTDPGLGEFEVRDGVCLTCGDGVLFTGEHIDPERHLAALREQHTPTEDEVRACYTLVVPGSARAEHDFHYGKPDRDAEFARFVLGIKVDTLRKAAYGFASLAAEGVEPTLNLTVARVLNAAADSVQSAGHPTKG